MQGVLQTHTLYPLDYLYLRVYAKSLNYNLTSWRMQIKFDENIITFLHYSRNSGNYCILVFPTDYQKCKL